MSINHSVRLKYANRLKDVDNIDLLPVRDYNFLIEYWAFMDQQSVWTLGWVQISESRHIDIHLGSEYVISYQNHSVMRLSKKDANAVGGVFIGQSRGPEDAALATLDALDALDSSRLGRLPYYRVNAVHSDGEWFSSVDIKMNELWTKYRSKPVEPEKPKPTVYIFPDVRLALKGAGGIYRIMMTRDDKFIGDSRYPREKPKLDVGIIGLFARHDIATAPEERIQPTDTEDRFNIVLGVPPHDILMAGEANFQKEHVSAPKITIETITKLLDDRIENAQRFCDPAMDANSMILESAKLALRRIADGPRHSKTKGWYSR